jgi:MoxR-like ATPase
MLSAAMSHRRSDVMLSAAMSHRRNDVMLSVAKHLALVRPFHVETQSEILRCAQDDSEALRMTARRSG